MNRIFHASEPFRVPDCTLVSPFLNAKDSMSGLPFDLLEGFSLAAGTIEPGVQSKIHVMPFVSQVTFVRSGKLGLQMKGQQDVQPYLLELEPGQAALTQPGTFLRLINQGLEPCEVLYVVSPPYLFEKTDEVVFYDDSLVLDEDWLELAANQWRPSKPLPTSAQRQETHQRLADRSAWRQAASEDRFSTICRN